MNRNILFALATTTLLAGPASAAVVETKCTITHYKKGTNRTTECKWRQAQGNVQVWLNGRKKPYRFNATGQGHKYVRINTSNRITLTRLGRFSLTIWQQ